MAELSVQGLEALQASMQRYLRTVNNPRQKQRLLFVGGREVRKESAKAPTPKSTKPHFYYRKGQKIKIIPGNLRRSMKVYRAKTGDVLIGPRVLRKIGNVDAIGRTQKTSSGYYASMIYKGAAMFRQRIMEPALSRATAAALRAIDKAYNRLHNSLTR